MVMQLIYRSEPFGFDSAILTNILATARRNNPVHGITGALICRHDIYLQLIEGDAAPIDALFNRIAADDRHLEVTLLTREDVGDRMFPDWAMLHDPARSWLWTPDEVAGGAIERASTEALRAVFARAGVEASAAAARRT